MLRLKAEALSFANTHFELTQRKFINGNTDTSELNTIKALQMDALESYEQTRSELNKALLQLEILSKTKILNR